MNPLRHVVSAAIRLVALCLASTETTEAACVSPPSGLVSWWSGDDTAYDLAGFNHGVLRSGAAYANGKVGRGFSVDGVDDYVQLSTFGMDVGTGEFTLMGWAKTSSTRGFSIFSYEYSNPALSITSNGMLRLYPREIGPSVAGFNDGQFHHFAMARRNGVLSFYKDAALIGTNDYTDYVGQFRAYIGRDLQGTGGVIDEVAFFNRSLTGSEIASIFGAGIDGMCKPPQPSLPFFIEAEDFDFNSGQHQAEADLIPYFGGAYNSLSATAEIDYHDPDANENAAYRPPSQGVATSGSSDTYRDSYVVTTSHKVGWNDGGDWYNYTRVFPATARSYNIYAQLSSAALPNAVQLDEVVSGAGTVHQTVVKIGRALGPATGYWDYFNSVPVTDDAGNPVTVTFGGQKTIRLTILAGGNEDINYLQFVPVQAPSGNPCVTSPSGLVGWWPGDGHARDLQGTIHGTLVNGASYRAGKVGETFAFDGANDYVDTALDVQPSAMPSTTWECWVFPSRVDPYRRQILSCDDGGYDRSVLVENGYFGVFVGWGVWYPIGSTPNQWQHIAVVFNTNNVEFYKNGIRFSYNAAPAGQPTVNKLQIGRNPGFGEYFDGRIDEVGIYNRALSPVEIQSIYNAGNSGRCKTTVVCPNLTVAPSSLSTGALGTVYTEMLVAVGGAAPYTFALASGSRPLPPSLTLSSNGLLSGSLNSTGRFYFTVRATDNNGCSKPQSYSLTVNPRPPPCPNLPAGLVSWWRAETNAEDAIGVNSSVALNGTTFALGKVGQAFSFDGSTNYIRVGTNGLNVGAGDFTLEGWIKTTATRNYSCILSFDSYNPAIYIRGNGVLQFYPYAAAPDTPATKFNDGQFHHFAVARASGGVTYYKDGLVIGTIAGGIVMNAQNIYIGADTYAGEEFPGLIDELSFYNRALSANEVQAVFTKGNGGKCNQISCPTITLSPLTLPNGTREVTYNVTCVASGGTAPYTFAISSGALPAGLSLSSAGGALSGTPGTAGFSSFTITATDAAGCSGTQVYSLAVNATAGGGGVAVAWGENGTGQLGDGTLLNRTPILPLFVKTVGPLAGKIVTSLAGGVSHSLVLASDGTVVSFGRNSEGQLGSGTTTNNTDLLDPFHIDLYRIDANGALAGKRVTAIAAGDFHSLALTSDGKVFGWGENNFGALGNNGTVMQTLPVPVDDSGVLAGKVVIDIAAGGQHSLALTSDRKLYQWGRIYSDVFTSAHNKVPVAVEMNGALNGKAVIAIADGGAHCLVLTSDGKLFAWGNNTYGQLGNGTSNATLVPMAVDMTGALNGQRVAAIGASYYHSLALASDGRVYAWGNNGYGQLGDGTTTGKSLPGQVGGDLLGRTSVAIACGGTFGVALLSDGTVYNWGLPITRDSRNIPIAVSADRPDSALTGRTVLGIAAGGAHALAIVTSQNQNCPAIALSPNTLPEGGPGSAYNQTITATGGGAPYTFTASGSLPGGLTLSSAGVLAGTLPAAGSFSIEITATDSTNCSGTKSYTITVSTNGPDIAIAPTTLNFTNVVAGQGALAAAALPEEPAAPAAANKITDAQNILGPLAGGNETVRVMVKLAEPDERRNVNWRNHASAGAARAAIKQRQDRALNRHAATGGIKVRRRFDNQASFSAEVNWPALQRLLNDPDVLSVEPVLQIQPHLAQGLPLMKAMTYRSTYSGDGVAVAICDTGVDYNHPRLGGGGFPNAKVIGGYDFGNDDANPIPASRPASAHGTACAGIAAGDLGTVGDYIGGVAPGAKIYALKISTDGSESASTDDSAAAWDWCVTHQNDNPNFPIMVISHSYGGGQYFTSCDGAQPVMAAAANAALAAGITIFASSGNDGYCDSIGSPACVSSAIAVGAVYDADVGSLGWCVNSNSCVSKTANTNCGSGFTTTENSAPDKVIAFSNTGGSLVKVLAPSNQASTPDILGAGGYTGGDYYTGFGGTSAACPYAAGAALALQSAAKALLGRFLTPAEIRAKLIATGDSINDPKGNVAIPRVNLSRAIETLVPGKSFVIFNNGNAPLNITGITLDAPASWISWSPPSPFTVAPGGSNAVTVSVNFTNAPAGQTTRRLLVASNDSDENPYPGGVFVMTAKDTVSRLVAQPSGRDITLMWAATLDTQLQTTTALNPPVSWVAATNQPVLVGDQKVVTIAPTGGQRFYRLAPAP